MKKSIVRKITGTIFALMILTQTSQAQNNIVTTTSKWDTVSQNVYCFVSPFLKMNNSHCGKAHTPKVANIETHTNTNIDSGVNSQLGINTILNTSAYTNNNTPIYTTVYKYINTNKYVFGSNPSGNIIKTIHEYIYATNTTGQTIINNYTNNNPGNGVPQNGWVGGNYQVNNVNSFNATTLTGGTNINGGLNSTGPNNFAGTTTISGPILLPSCAATSTPTFLYYSTSTGLYCDGYVAPVNTNINNLVVSGTSTFNGPIVLSTSSAAAFTTYFTNGTNTYALLPSGTVTHVPAGSNLVITLDNTGKYVYTFSDNPIFASVNATTVNASTTNSNTGNFVNLNALSSILGNATATNLNVNGTATFASVATGSATAGILVYGPNGEMQQVSASNILASNTTNVLTVSTSTNNYTWTSVVNGIVSTTTAGIINSNTVSANAGVLTTVVNGMVATTSIDNLYSFLASSSPYNNLTVATSAGGVVTYTFTNNPIFDTLTAATGTIQNINASTTNTSNLLAQNATTTNLFASMLNAVTGYFTNLFANTITASTTNSNTGNFTNLNTSGITNLATTSISGGLNLSGLNVGVATNSVMIIDPVTGVVSYIDPTTLVASNTTNILSSLVNVMTSNVNGVISTSSIVNSNTLTVSTTTNSFVLTSDVNGVVSTTTANFVNQNDLSTAVNTITSIVNGITSTSSIINSNTISAASGTITSIVNGVVATTSITNLYTFLASSTNNNLTVSTSTDGTVTYSFTNDAVFNSVTATNSSFVNSTSTNLFASNANFNNASSTNLFANLLNAVTGYIQNLFADTITATTTNTTNLNASSSILGNATATTLTINSVATGSATSNILIYGPNGQVQQITTADMLASNTTNVLTVSTTTNSYLWTSIVNGIVSTTTANIINLNNITASSGVITTNINGVIATTSIANLYTFLASSTNSNLTVTTQPDGTVTYTLSDNPIFNSVTATTSTFVNSNITNATITNATNTNLFSQNATASNLFANSASFDNASSTNLFASVLNAISGFISNLVFGNATGTNMTSGNFTATSTATLATTTLTSVGNGSATSSLLILGPNGLVQQVNPSDVLASNTTNVLTVSTSTNSYIWTSIVNGIVSTTTAGIINNNTLGSLANILTSNVNGVVSTSSIINSNVITAASGTITSTVNGITATTSISNLYTFLVSSTNNNLTVATATDGTVTYSFTNNPIFNSVNATTSNSLTSNSSTTNALTGNITNLNASSSVLGNATATTLAIGFVATGSPTSTVLVYGPNGIVQQITPAALLASNTTNLIQVATTTNAYVWTTTVNGIVSTTTASIINLNTLSSAANVMSSNVNGITSTSSIINSNLLTFTTSTSLLSSVINGIISTTSLANLLCNNVLTGIFSFCNGGNSSGANNTLGTNDNFAQIFETNGAERARITNTGLFGIGTNAPSSDLHIKKNVAGGVITQTENTDTSANGYAETVSQNGSVRNILGAYEAGNYAYVGTESNHDLRLSAGNTTWAALSVAGNFGIGSNVATLSPTNKLHVEDITDPLRLEGVQTQNPLDNILNIDSAGVVHKIGVSTLLASNTTNVVSTTTNTFTSIVNGVSSAVTNFINSFTQSATGNTLTSTINGVTATSSIITNNNINYATSTEILTTNINGVISTTSIPFSTMDKHTTTSTASQVNLAGIATTTVNFTGVNGQPSYTFDVRDLDNQTLTYNNLTGQLAISAANGLGTTSVITVATNTPFNITDGVNTQTVNNNDTVTFSVGSTGALTKLVSSSDTVTYDIKACADNEVLSYNAGASTWDCKLTNLRYYAEDITNPAASPTVAAGTQGVAIGDTAQSNGTHSMTFGANSVTNGSESFTIGNNNTNGVSEGGVMGIRNTVDGNNSYVTGRDITASGIDQSFVSAINTALNNFKRSILQGVDNVLGGGTYENSQIIGNTNTLNDMYFSTVLGSLNTTNNPVKLTNIIGYQNDIQKGSENTVIGFNNRIAADNSFTFGSNLTNAATGNVEIGTSDATKFTIDSTGRAVLRGAFNVANGDGSVGQVLQSQGTGVQPIWTNASSLIAAGNGISITGSPIPVVAINAPTCTGSTRLIWNGTAFVCQATTNTLTVSTSTNVINLVSTVNGIIATTSFNGVNSNTLSSVGNIMTNTTNGIVGTSTIINTNVATSTGNSLTTIINGITSTTANIINSFTQSLSGNTLTTTINGVVATSSVVSSNTLANASTTNSITLTNTTNGIVATSTFNIINLNVLSFATSTGTLSSTINGVLSTTTGIASTNCTSSLTIFCQDGNSFGALAKLGTNDNSAIGFETNNTEWMRLTTDGVLALRTTTPNTTPGFNSNALEFWDADGTHSDFTQRVAGGGWGVYNILAQNGTLAAPTAVINGGMLGEYAFGGYNGSAFSKAANVFAQADGVPSATSMPGRMVWGTTAAGALNPVERMRLDSQGNLGLGTTAPTNRLDVSATVDPLRLRGLQNGNATETILISDSLGVVHKISAGALLASSTTNTLTNASVTNAIILTNTTNGVVATTTFSLINSNTIATTTNTIQTIVNGITSTIANIINSFTQSLSGNTLTTTINGVVATSSVVSSNTLTSAANVMTNTTNGIVGTSTIINNATTTYATSTGLLTINVNGVIATTTVPTTTITNTATTSGNIITTTVNGVVATTTAVTSNVISLATSTSIVSSVVNGITSTTSLANLLCNNTLTGIFSFCNGGNSSGANNTLGTNDNFAQIFETNNTERMRIFNNGQISVGTTTAGNLFNIGSSTGAISGLRLGITSASPSATSTNKVLAVNANGDVMNVIVPGTENIIDFNTINPNIATTTFSPNQPSDPDVIYFSNIDNSQWKWATSSYVTYNPTGNNWSILGNSNINPAVNFLGTTNANDVIFKGNNVEGLRILGGNTFTGSGQLTLNTINAGDTVLSGDMFFKNPGTGNNPGAFQWMLTNDNAAMYAKENTADQTDFNFRLGDNAEGGADRYVFWETSYQGAAQDKWPAIFTGTYAAFDPKYTGNNHITGSLIGTDTTMYMDYNTNRVAIGNINPNNKLEITHGTAGNSGLRFTNLLSTSPTVATTTKVLSVDANGDVIFVEAGINASTTCIVTGQFGCNNGNTLGANLTLGTNDAFAQIFETSNTERMRITANGQVSIGTTVSGNLLNVASSTGAVSGLRLAINAATTATSSNGKVLTVNANGDVMLVNDSSVSGVDVSAQKSTALTAALTAAPQTVIFNSELTDINNSHNNVTGIYIAPVTDMYEINASIQIQTPGIGANSTALTIRRNGVVIVESVSGNTNDCCTAAVNKNINVSATIALTAGQTVDIQTYLKQGAAATFVAADNTNFLTIKRVGAAAVVSSDSNLKKNIQDFTLGLKDILGLRTVSYEYNGLSKFAVNDGTKHVGIIAQEVASSSLGSYAISTGTDGYLKYDQSAVIYALVNSVKEQDKNLNSAAGMIVLLENASTSVEIIDVVKNETPRNAYDHVLSRLDNTKNIINDFVAAKVTAIRGYFDEIFTKKIHTEMLCVKKSDGTEFCADGDQLQNAMNNSGQIVYLNNPAASTTATTTTVTASTTSSATSSTTTTSTSTATTTASTTPSTSTTSTTTVPLTCVLPLVLDVVTNTCI